MGWHSINGVQRQYFETKKTSQPQSTMRKTNWRWKSSNFNQHFHPTVSNLPIHFLTPFSANLYHKVGKIPIVSLRRRLIALCEQEKAEKAREDPWSGTLGTFGPSVESPREAPVSAFPCVAASPRWGFNSWAVLTEQHSPYTCHHCNISSWCLPWFLIFIRDRGTNEHWVELSENLFGFSDFARVYAKTKEIQGTLILLNRYRQKVSNIFVYWCSYCV